MNSIEWFIEYRLNEWHVFKDGEKGGWLVEAWTNDGDDDDWKFTMHTLHFDHFSSVNQVSIAQKIMSKT